MVSDQGRVRSLLTGKIMAQELSIHGYLRVALSVKRGKSIKQSVHQLVLFAFVGPKPDGGVTRHRDGIRTHNVVGNLCWGTYEENSADRVVHGTNFLGGNHPCAKLSNENVLYIRDYPYKYGSDSYLARQFGVTPALVRGVRQHRYWKHL
jgi:hypothetical protein